MKVLSNWKEVYLESHVDLLSGFAFKSKYFTDNPEDIPLVKCANLHQGYIDWENAKRWNIAEYDKHEKFQLKLGDVLVAMDRPWIEAGLKFAWISESDPKSLLVQRVARLRGKNGLLTEYIRYLIGSPSFTDYIKPIVTGINVPHISGKQIKEFQFSLPPLSTQHKIASILSAYDDLIENNNRRIKILESMAQTLYQEWFVKFRFPGYKQVKMVESELGLIPEGWEVHKLGDVVELAYGKSLRAKDRLGGEIVVYGSGGVIGYHNQYLAEAPGIIVGRKGNVGKVFWSDKNFFPIDTVYFVKTQVCLHYVYFNLQNQNFINNDAAVPELNRNQAYSLPFILPDKDLLNRFQDFVSLIFIQLKNLREKNDNLRKTRDLLLPKLISGQIDVENLDIDTGELAA